MHLKKDEMKRATEKGSIKGGVVKAVSRAFETCVSTAFPSSNVFNCPLPLLHLKIHQTGASRSPPKKKKKKKKRKLPKCRFFGGLLILKSQKEVMLSDSSETRL